MDELRASAMEVAQQVIYLSSFNYAYVTARMRSDHKRDQDHINILLKHTRTQLSSAVSRDQT